MEEAVAKGVYDSREGVKLDHVMLREGGAKVKLQGALMGEAQDAQLTVTDLPAELL